MGRTNKQKEIDDLKKRVVELENIITDKNKGIAELELENKRLETRLESINQISKV